MSRAIRSIIDKIWARWAWYTAWEDTPKCDVQRNSVTGAARWRPTAAMNSDGKLYPWRPGLPPAGGPPWTSELAQSDVEARTDSYLGDGCVPFQGDRKSGPVVYGFTATSDITDAIKSAGEGGREPVIVLRSPGIGTSSILQEAMKRASENMQMTGGLTMAHREGAARPPRVVIVRLTESLYRVNMDFPTGIFVQNNLTLDGVGRILKRMSVAI